MILFKYVLIVYSIFFFMLAAGSMHQPRYVQTLEFHTVEFGETLWSISCDVYDKGIHRDVREIMFDIAQDNNIRNGQIYPGRILKIHYWKKID